jgi:hypothetical protein
MTKLPFAAPRKPTAGIRGLRVRVPIVLAALLAALAGLSAPAAGGGAPPTPRSMVVAVAHGPVTADNSQYTDAGPAGPSVADLRTYFLPLTRPGGTARIGYLTGTLLTTATDQPKARVELRTANLVFVVGEAADQLVVGGVSAYAQTAPTLSKKSVTTRPVIGGSGKYAGARGWCVSTHFANDTWTHVFHITVERS